MNKKHSISPRYKALQLTCFVLGIFFLGSLNTTAVIQHSVYQAFRAVPEEHHASLTDSSDLQLRNVHHCSLDRKPVNILLIGQDRQEGELRARSDCMILCTFRPGNHTLTMTSFLRDLYVEIPGYSKNRLNAAYAFGGTSLLQQTFQQNFGISPDGCVEVDFAQFPALIDLFGGVTISLRADEAGSINCEVPGSTLREGSQILNGQQALAYTRIRDLDSDGDFSRTDRQRKILIALFSCCRNASMTELVQLFKKAAPMLSTDIKQSRLLSLIGDFSPLMSRMEIVAQRIPVDGTYSHRIIDGMAVLVSDMEANRSFLKSTLE